MHLSSYRNRKWVERSAITAVIFMLNLLIVNPVPAQQKEDGNRDAIVKIYTVNSKPDYFNPWRMMNTGNISGSGCIIKGKKILTNAHVVADHTFIQIRRYGQAKRYNAHILSVSHEADLALLTVSDEEFFFGVTPLKFGRLPETQQEVLVYGFPVGGDSLSITKGILSRIEHQNYTHSSHYFLAGQIDAAINPGNSGGPVLVKNKIVGVVMQTYSPSRSENIGYMVPSLIVTHFLRDIEDRKYDGFPAVGLVTQNLENPDMKRKYGISDTMTGIVVNHVVFSSPAEGKIFNDDILLSIDGHTIGNDGTVEFREKERTHFSHYINLHQLGEELNLEVFREGSVRHVSLPLKSTQTDIQLVPRERYDRNPRYFIFGGIVFSPLTKNLLKRWGGHWNKKAPKELVVELSNWPSSERREVVVAVQVLAADVNQGYHDISNWITTEVNGKPIRDFNELYHIVTNSTDPFIVFKNDKGFRIVIDREKALKSRDQILKTYSIKQDRSSDLMHPDQTID